VSGESHETRGPIRQKIAGDRLAAGRQYPCASDKHHHEAGEIAREDAKRDGREEQIRTPATLARQVLRLRRCQ